ncbi:hypothetical protein EDD21DRAFT_387298 [Dissophora ornata]|nr:hypothetical protein EDD21DRAFT_387298 [Dissophora ornata]
MLSSKFIVCIIALATSLTIDVAAFRCDRNFNCRANVSNGNTCNFGRKHGCTADGRYCSHATNNDITDIKIWVCNVNAGCTVAGNFYQDIFDC